jgi:hypothetical protein
MPQASAPAYKPRELRRSVMLAARMHTETGWSGVCVLNVSSRGLLVHARVPVSEGSTIELRHGDHAIIAEVVWRTGRRAGLRAQDAVPVEDLLLLGGATALRLDARPVGRERRRRTRNPDESRDRGRAIEFAGTVVIATVLAVGAFSMVEQAFAAPLAYVRGALGG